MFNYFSFSFLISAGSLRPFFQTGWKRPYSGPGVFAHQPGFVLPYCTGPRMHCYTSWFGSQVSYRPLKCLVEEVAHCLSLSGWALVPGKSKLC